jgi:hypothetical protein
MNVKALNGTVCWECHSSTGKFLPRRQYLSENQFYAYVRRKDTRFESDQGRMPAYSQADISDDDLKRIYLLLYSTLSQ